MQPTGEPIKKPYLIFQGIKPRPEDVPAFEKFAALVHKTLRKVNVEPDTMLIHSHPKEMMGLGDASLASEGRFISSMGIPREQLNYTPRICFSANARIALGAAKMTDEDVSKKLEGALLHEAWHILTPRNRITQLLDVYKHMLNNLAYCGSVSKLPESQPILMQHFGSPQNAAQFTQDIKNKVTMPLEKLLPSMKELTDLSPETLADRFAESPFSLLPEEEPWKDVAVYKDVEDYGFQLQQLAMKLHGAGLRATVANSTEEKMTNAKSRQWTNIAARYKRALEYSCDEFGKANAERPESMREFLADDVRTGIRMTANVASISFTPEQSERILEAALNGSQLANKEEQWVLDGINMRMSKELDPLHPSHLDRIRRLDKTDTEHSPYRI